MSANLCQIQPIRGRSLPNLLADAYQSMLIDRRRLG